ncbi:hypothetical protein F3Y22_tig00110988pilonHSYRG00448 [Hibiscus syriacus]|uniref:Transferase n=1 Tax=Hibiscus syriacus TaxID=106335 RepID=A0A6A2ZBD0_HIBSY|nr:hypothetical protein F3Y22_tig00110988pilonHSYRG00448 [Hibiscus syriacus]
MIRFWCLENDDDNGRYFDGWRDALETTEGVPLKEPKSSADHPVPEELNKLFPFPLDDAAELPMGIQFNVFVCGGIGIGLCVSHRMGDASSYFTFLNTWAAISRGDDKDVVKPEFVSDKLFPAWNLSAPEPLLAPTTENGIHPSHIEALSAFIWTRFIASTKENPLRTRFEPPLSAQSLGNIFHLARIIPSMEKEKDDGSYNLVSQMRESIRRIDKDYVRKLQVGESGSFKGKTIPFIFTNLCRFPPYEADFGWGKPVWVSSANLSTKDVVVFMDSANGDGIEAWIHLKDGDMVEFGSDEELLKTV